MGQRLRFSTNVCGIGGIWKVGERVGVSRQAIGVLGEDRKVWGGFLVSCQSFGAGRGGRRCGAGWAFLVRFSEKDDF